MKNIGICVTFDPSFKHMFLIREIEKDLDAISKIGFKTIELSLRDISDIDWEEFNYYLDKYDLKIITFATGLIKKIDNITLMDKEKSGLAVKRIKEMMSILSQIDYREKNILIGYTKGDIEKSKRVEQLEILKKSLNELLEVAEENSINLLIEVINHKDTNFINTIHEGVNYISKFNSEFLKLVIDSYQMNIDESDLYKSITEAKDYIGYVHLSDDNRGYPGFGNLDFQVILQALKDINYKKYLMFECKTINDKYSEIFEGYKNISDLIKKIGY